jgi:mannose-6-phosphate isomerase-like protein (cupin superfamily)
MDNQVPFEIHDWTEIGYSPLVFSHDWQVAVLNWEPAADAAAIHEVERHQQTDEVFVLWRGRAALIVAAHGSLNVIEVEQGKVHNVTKGTWHTVFGDRESSWIIVENRDTHLVDTELREMSADEKEQFCSFLPVWAKPRPEKSTG